MSDKINPEHYKRLPAEAIEIIESAIQNAPTCQDAYLQGQALKYLLRCWHKEGITDIKKAKWYIDRLVESYDKSLADIKQGTLKAQQSDLGQPQLPNGWRWLNEDEVIRKGDAYWHGGKRWDYDNSIGAKVRDTVWPSIRRDRFEVGEKVVQVFNECVYEITAILDGNFYEMQTPSGYKRRFYAIDLAPYIEETT